jgi:hypothetical protein
MTKKNEKPGDWEAKIDGYISDIGKSIAYLEKLQ